jgi:hypothetical protein
MPKLTKYEKVLALLFLLTLPLVNPWVRGDGVGYYAFARAPLISHDLDFRPDWLNANSTFRMWRTGDDGTILPDQFTATGHLDNHFAVGPAILWAPFLVIAHASVLAADVLGTRTPANGFSRPYTFAMALGTALYGFLALLISLRIARRYAPEQFAFIATLAIWFASSLPVYMYFNPSWSHAQSAFIVAVFLWYWLERLGARSLGRWMILGAIGGLMMDVYYINAVLLLLPFGESLWILYSAARSREVSRFASMIASGLAFSVALLAAFSPTLISKKIIYGNFLNFGYTEKWDWSSPAALLAAFSSDHGVFTWTPILLLSVVGLFCLSKESRVLKFTLVGVFAAYLYVVGCYQDWDGLSSYGNRFFVSLTPVYVIGLAALFAWMAQVARPVGASVATSVAAVLVALNLGLIFQWGTHLIPSRGPISLQTTVYNEIAVVPAMAVGTLKNYLTGRSTMMNQIEQQDIRQLKSGNSGDTP